MPYFSPVKFAVSAFCLADIFLLKSVTPAGSVTLERVIAFIGDFTFRGENKPLRYPFGGTTFVSNLHTKLLFICMLSTILITQAKAAANINLRGRYYEMELGLFIYKHINA